MTHNITGCEAIDRGEQDFPLAFRQVAYRAKAAPWRAIGFLALGALLGIALILIPAAIQAARHPIPAF